MKLEALKSVEIKGIKIPRRVLVPDFADPNKLSDRIFGAFCRINPELGCMEDIGFISNVFKCIAAAGGKDYYADYSEKLKKNNLYTIGEYVRSIPEVKKWRDWYAKAKIEKAAYNAEHKDEIKAAKDEFKELYGNVIINGISEPLQSCAVEPEGIYFGRGNSPLRGYWKFEHTPKDVKVNTNSKNLPVLIRVGEDECDEETVEIVKDWNVSWNPNAHFAAQYNNLVGLPNPDGTVKELKATKYKMIQFGALSSVKKEGQTKKYAAASVLGKSYDVILAQVVKDFEKAIKTGKTASLGTAIAVYVLLKKGIRIGGPQPTVNGTKGLLALVWGKEVTRKSNVIKFNFIGKDSVKDSSEIECESEEIAEIIQEGWSRYGKLMTDKASIKAYVGKIAPDIANTFSPKLCRTAVAASVMLKALDEVVDKYKLTEDSPEALKKLAFNEANMAVARRLNHQRGVSKSAEARREEANKEKKEKLQDRANKNRELEERRLERIATLKKAKKDGWQDKVNKIQEQISKSKDRINQSKLDLQFKVENGNITASTSKSAYIDPGIVKDFCTKYKLSIEKVYTKSQIAQFSQFLGEGED